MAGKNIANPLFHDCSVAMMLENIFGMEKEAKNVWAAMQAVFAMAIQPLIYRNRQRR